MSPLFAHEGSFSWGPDLTAGTLLTSDEGFWKKLFDKTQWPAGGTEFPMLEPTASDAFPGYMQTMLSLSHDHLEDFDAGGIDTALSALKKFFEVTGQDLKVDVGDSTTGFSGYTPVRARWLESQWQPFFLIPIPEKHYDYPDYLGFQDIRERGARLYCAARRAQIEQNSTTPSLGERVGYSFSLLGHTVDLLVLQSSVVVNGPQRCTGGSGDAPDCPGSSSGSAPNDGAQSFEVPLLLGNLFTPIRGLGLPPLVEYPCPLLARVR